MSLDFVPQVVSVRHLGGHRIWMKFRDGVEGELDVNTFRPFVGLKAALEDPAYVGQVRIPRELGTIAWPNGWDVCPTVLYCAVKGIPVPSYD